MGKIIIANWKMNPGTLDEAKEIVNFLSQNYDIVNNQLIICPPFMYFGHLRDMLQEEDKDSFKWGAQDIFWEDSGPYTGEISPLMLKDFWVEYVIIGHSERRWKLSETDEMINKKVIAAINNNMTPILAVGEKEKTDPIQDVLVDQLSRALEGVKEQDVSRIIVAYEPVWAISKGAGRGEADSPEDTVEAISVTRDIIEKLYSAQAAKSVQIIYGGSVNSDNAESFLGKEEIAGALVGGASLNKEEFLKILQIAEQS